jgi:hypothetical protein
MTMTTLKDKLTGAVESVFLASIFAWSIAATVAVTVPPTREHQGTVEIHQLAPASEVSG